MEESSKKTIVCSVLFLDIAEYSKKSVSEQILLKDGFNAFLSTAILEVPIDDRIILDTGSGAIISFLGNVEVALKAALIMRASLLGAGTRMEPPLLVHMGINLGPVRLVKDANDLPNIVGDGINVAQRVMGFSDPGQILVSRSYYEAVSSRSQAYAGMFHYEGPRTDKHVREHHIYAIGYPGEFTATLQHMALAAKGTVTTRLDRLLSDAQYYTRIAELRLIAWARLAFTLYHTASFKRRAVYLAALMIPIALLILLAFKGMQDPIAPALSVAETPTNIVTPTQLTEASTPNLPAKEEAKKLPTKQENVRTKSARVRTLEETTAINTGAPARVNLAVSPWGEIYLDGRIQGVSPPLTELEVMPGTHEIEIRNTTFPPYSRVIRAKAGGVIKIQHKFK